MFEVYKSQYNPTNLTGQVGGGIGTEMLSGYLGELFYHIATPPSGIDEIVYQYRKVFVKNTYAVQSTYTRVWIDSLEHTDQISVANSYTLNDTASTPTGQPTNVTGWSLPTDYAEGLPLGTLNPNTSTGFWIRQALSGIASPDPYATFRLYVGGVVSP